MRARSDLRAAQQRTITRLYEELRAIGWRVYLAKDRGEVDAVIEAEVNKDPAFHS